MSMFVLNVSLLGRICEVALLDFFAASCASQASNFSVLVFATTSHDSPIRSICCSLLLDAVGFAEGRVKHRSAGVAPAISCISLTGTVWEVSSIRQSVERGIL